MASVRPPSIPPFSVVLLACALSVHSGCSLAIQGAEPDRPRNEVPKCDTGKGLVALDGLAGSLLGLSSLGAFGDDADGAGAALLVGSALFFASAVRGNNAANSCRGAYEEYNAQLMSAPRGDMVAGPVEVVPRPAVKKKPVKKTPPPEIEPHETMTPPQVDPQPPVAGKDQEPEPVAPEYASPRPPSAKPPAVVLPPAPAAPTKQPPPPKKPPPPPPDDEWGDFWKEVP